jgi:probable HAF family extracellular repeat protein
MDTLSRLVRTAVRIFLPFLVLAAATAWGARETRWTVVDLNPPGAELSVATGVNNRGEVAGWFTESCPVHGFCERPFVWDNGLRTLPTPPEVPHARARGINDAGTVVGHTTLLGLQAVAWKDGQYTPLGFEGEAIRINRRGDIACTARVGGFQRACLLRDGVLHEFGTFGGTTSHAMELNDRGQVTGTAAVANGDWRAFVWENGTMSNLGTLGGAYSLAYSINDRGVVVGYSSNAAGQTSAFEWSGGTMNAIPGAPAGGVAFGINDRGVVVGRMGGKSYMLDDGVLTILDDLPEIRAKGFTELQPIDINERGWIVGWGMTEAGMRGFVLIPK